MDNFNFDSLDPQNNEVEDLFFEEFDSNDIANRHDNEEIAKHNAKITPFVDESKFTKTEDKAKAKKFFTEEDIENIVSYPDERRMDKGFISKFGDSVRSVEVTPDNPHLSFKDFIIAPKIAGNRHSISDKKRIPFDLVEETGTSIEIIDDHKPNKDEKHLTNILIHRDVEGDVEFIEINCKCGERTLLKFEVNENSKTELTQSYSDRITDPYQFNENDFDESAPKTKVSEDEFMNLLGDKLEEDEPFVDRF